MGFLFLGKEYIVKKRKFIVAFLLVCVLSMGGAVSVFAFVDYKGDYTDVIASDLNTYTIPGFSDKNVLFLTYGGYEYLYVSPETDNNYNSSGLYPDDLYIKAVLWKRKSGGTWTSQRELLNYPISKSSISSYVYYANEDIAYDGTVFFQRTEVPAAVVARILPETVEAEVKKILAVAVGCLALVIGSMVLLPRLKLYLKG